MNAETYSSRIHSWIPVKGHALCHAGIHFDAVRIRGTLAERVASEMMCCTDFNADADGSYVAVGLEVVPTADVPFVDVALLREVVGRVSGVRR
ncbi:hypothetical protein [Streptomyces sp. NPDC127197]|uniref:hypothetical protein n=1 Tax=Streptomyces sp. NPDC127197 TaxID=3345388 RepID=UPI003637734F